MSVVCPPATGVVEGVTGIVVETGIEVGGVIVGAGGNGVEEIPTDGWVVIVGAAG